MLAFLAALQLANALTMNNACSCDQLLTPFDCLHSQKYQVNLGDVDPIEVCFWREGKCYNLSDYEQYISCSSLNDEQCTNSPICIWTGRCRKFTKCQDYKLSCDESACRQLGCLTDSAKCTYDLMGRQEQYCEQISNKLDCESTYISDKKHVCNWTNEYPCTVCGQRTTCGTCAEQEITLCSDILKQSQCEAANQVCTWNGSCVKRSCSHKQTQYLGTGQICVSFLDLETNLFVECGEDGSSCVEMSSDSLQNTTYGIQHQNPVLIVHLQLVDRQCRY